MIDQLKCLIEYQKLETKKLDLIRSSEEGPARIAELERDFQAFESNYLAKKEEVENARTAHKSIEQSIADIEARIGRSRNRMKEVKNNKEYQAIGREIDDAKKEISAKEEGALALMENVEKLEGEIAELEKEVENRRALMEEERASLLESTGKIQSRLDKLGAFEDSLRARLDSDLVKRTDMLFKRQAGVAVAPVENGVCQMCHLNIPPQKFIEIQRDENIHQCPHCHRFIYWPGHEGYCDLTVDFEDI